VKSHARRNDKGNAGSQGRGRPTERRLETAPAATKLQIFDNGIWELTRFLSRRLRSDRSRPGRDQRWDRADIHAFYSRTGEVFAAVPRRRRPKRHR
jgi:hypothetical protein